MKKILLLLSNGFEAYEASVFTDIVGFSQRGQNANPDVSLESVGLHSRLTCAYGFSVMPNRLLSATNVSDFDALAVPGGTTDSGFYEDAYSAEFLEVIQQFDASKKPIAAICTGGMPVAKSGVLRSRHATTFPGKRQAEMHSYGAQVISDEEIVRDGNIITSASPRTGVRVVFQLLELMGFGPLPAIRPLFQ